MAQLNERDRQVLLGDRMYSEDLSEIGSKSPVKVNDVPQDLVTDLERNSDHRFSATFIGVTGCLVAWGSFQIVGFVNYAVAGGLVSAGLGFVGFVWLSVQRRRLEKSSENLTLT